MNNIDELRIFVKLIVEKSKILKDKYTKEYDAKVNYACIFCQNESDFIKYISILKEDNNEILEDTYSGPLFRIKDLDTVSGTLKLLKIRRYDKEHLELGDADFTIKNYNDFKNNCLNKKEFSIISKQDFEMSELMEKDSDVRVYFSYPPIDEDLGIF